jgi:ABC-type siderophore export system fused ATPase/permease subunit
LQKTVLVVTHDSRIFRLADRIVKLVDGFIVAESAADASLPKEPEVLSDQLSAATV